MPYLTVHPYSIGVPRGKRIRHRLQKPRWPSAAEAKRAKLFQQVQLGPIQLSTRTWVPAMVPWRATHTGEVTSALLQWYGRFARGRPGAIVVEATGIRDIPSGPLLRIGDDRFIEGLKQLVDTVQKESQGETKLLIQIIDFLSIKRRPPAQKFFERFLQLTPTLRARLSEYASKPALLAAPEPDVRNALLELGEAGWEAVLSARELEALRMGLRERVTDVHLPHIRELPKVLPDLFASAAARAETAGFDGVELHFAHAYTMASFLSRKNDRTDGFGGPRENRVRLPLDVYQSCRARLRNAALGCRFLADEVIEGGSDVEDAKFFGVEFAKAGMDYLSLSKGGKFEDAKQPKVGEAAYPYTGESGHECMPTIYSDVRGPLGRNLPLAAAVRAAVRAAGLETPVIAAGGINTFDIAEGALQKGDADIIASARQCLADPDWFLKMRLGRGEEIRSCALTNYCEGLDQRHKQVTCRLWDRVFLQGEEEVMMAHDNKRRLVAPPWKR